MTCVNEIKKSVFKKKLSKDLQKNNNGMGEFISRCKEKTHPSYEGVELFNVCYVV